MAIEILDSWKEFDANFALVKTSGGIFTISRGQTSYAVERTAERFSVIPCRVSQKIVDIYWPVGKNPMDMSKSSRGFIGDLSKIKDLTGVNPFELMEIVKEKDKE